MYQNLTEERSMLKQAEIRLMEENKSLINQQKGQNTLLTNLQTIQVCLIHVITGTLAVSLFVNVVYPLYVKCNR